MSKTNAPPLLHLDGISRDFDGHSVVKNLSLELNRGEVTCLLGPSGCGKTTTLRIAAGVDKQTRGTVRISGQTVSDRTRHLPPERRSIGLMFQEFALFPHLNVFGNISFGIRGNRQEKTAKVQNLLKKVDLAGSEAKYPHQLSGGEQQRVALARALAPKPNVMLMDEPFSGLDDRLRDEVRDATLDLLKQEGTAVLLVTHEPTEAMRMADQIALMRDGEIVQLAAPYNLYNAPVDKAAAGFFSDINEICGTAKNALVDTAFGQFLTPGLVDGTQVEIVIRPQHLKIDFDRQGKGPLPTACDGVPARGKVQRSRFLGNHSLVEFEMEFDQSPLKVSVPGVFLPKPDTIMWLSMRRDRCFVFSGNSDH